MIMWFDPYLVLENPTVLVYGANIVLQGSRSCSIHASCDLTIHFCDSSQIYRFKDKNYFNLAALVKNNQPVECNCLEGPCKYLKTTSIQYSVRLLRIAFRLSIGQEKSSHRLRVHCPMSKHAGPSPKSKARNPAPEGTNISNIKYSQKT